MNLPNKITIARVAMIPLFMLALFLGVLQPIGRYAAVGIFIIASISDFLDGYLARKMNCITTFGKFMDPIADKLLVASALISLAALGDIAAWMVVVIISREFIISGVRLVAAERGQVIAASMWAKIKTTMQMLMIIMILFRHDGMKPDNQVFSAVCELLKWLSVALTIISAYDYIYKNKDIFKAIE